MTSLEEGSRRGSAVRAVLATLPVTRRSRPCLAGPCRARIARRDRDHRQSAEALHRRHPSWACTSWSSPGCAPPVLLAQVGEPASGVTDGVPLRRLIVVGWLLAVALRRPWSTIGLTHARLAQQPRPSQAVDSVDVSGDRQDIRRGSDELHRRGPVQHEFPAAAVHDRRQVAVTPHDDQPARVRDGPGTLTDTIPPTL